MMMIFSFLSSVYATGNSLDIQVDVYGKREDNQKKKIDYFTKKHKSRRQDTIFVSNSFASTSCCIM